MAAAEPDAGPRSPGAGNTMAEMYEQGDRAIERKRCEAWAVGWVANSVFVFRTRLPEVPRALPAELRVQLRTWHAAASRRGASV
jgi:hypothetical protein